MGYDVVVAGGSVAGLLCAREIAAAGFSVMVAEEDYEIGTPEHCGGLASLAGLGELGVIPSAATWHHMVESAEITSPDGNTIHIDAKKQKVAEISRRELDKQIALQAQRCGATIRVRTSIQEMTGSSVRTGDGVIGCKIAVDARGAQSLVQKDRTGMLPSAQYEVYADWIKKGKVCVIIDQEKYPEFFAWIIPSNDGRGKVGVAGKGINAAGALDEILEKRGNYSIIRKIYAPLWVKGPIKKFVQDNVVIVGDAAGQAKPTTAGGIFTSGMGGIYAGRAIAEFLETGKESALEEYQKKWTGRFGSEFERQALARRVLGKISNDTINKLFGAITPEITAEISAGDDFDFHATSIIKLLGVRGSLNTAGTLVGGELKRLLGHRAD
ncbi:MAG: NAD(P)/FAD-dependent oxidoreductase [Nitrosopumilus sp. B06]|nr:MAG: NAD(P)/FAD-dependent oxidoreductase [Nitrosopumilus sp. B06]